MKKSYILLDNRGTLTISGEDSRNFLQGLITNDINKLVSSACVYTLMLTPQGKFLYDFFMYEVDGKILLDCNNKQITDINKKLNMYKLRSKVVIEVTSDKYQIIALSPTTHNLITYIDPRKTGLPARYIAKKPFDHKELENQGYTKGSLNDYEKIRINECVPSDLDMQDSFPLEYLMDTYNAIDYQKGCYVGQEVTARTHYRGIVRKKPYVFTAISGTDLTAYFGQEIFSNGGHKIGIMRSALHNIGIALIRIEEIEKTIGDIRVGDVALSVKQLP